MAGIGLWAADRDGPRRLQVTESIAERQLEEWIEHDPQLLEQGLQIVARQLRTAGGPLDLLGIDAQGRWVLIEIKRDRLRREVLAQAIDYASCLAAMDPQELFAQCDAYLSGRSRPAVVELLRGRGVAMHDEGLEPVIYLVGTGIDHGLTRMVEYLAKTATMSIRLVTFSVFSGHNGGIFITREIHEADQPPVARASTQAAELPSLDELQAQAEEHHAGVVWRQLVSAGEEAGLHARRYKKSVMLTPPQNRTRCAIYLPTDRRKIDGVAHAYVAADVFEEFLGVPQNRVAGRLGSEWVAVGQDGVDQFCEGIRELLEESNRAPVS